MTTLQIVILSLVQGITEFLPISSSAHLILVNQALGYGDEGLVFDTAAHLGSLLAVVIYFRTELVDMLLGRPVAGLDRQLGGHRLLWWLVLATLPVAVAGIVFADWIGHNVRGPLVIAGATIVFALVLWWSDRYANRGGRVSAGSAVAMGLAQVLALIPGTSRSGITISAGLFFGLSRHAAARFSFLMAIPAVAAAGAYGVKEIVDHRTTIAWPEFSLAVVVSGISALACIAAFIRLIDRIGMLPFVIYRLLLGAVILAVVLL